MLRKLIAALSAAIVLGTALPASAANRHHRVGHRDPAIYNMVPGAIGGGCSPTGVPLCSNVCSGSGPCAPPDHW